MHEAHKLHQRKREWLPESKLERKGEGEKVPVLEPYRSTLSPEHLDALVQERPWSFNFHDAGQRTFFVKLFTKDGWVKKITWNVFGSRPALKSKDMFEEDRTSSGHLLLGRFRRATAWRSCIVSNEFCRRRQSEEVGIPLRVHWKQSEDVAAQEEGSHSR